MKLSKIKEHNSQTFLEDLKKAGSVIAYTEKTDYYYNITKKDLILSSETKHINYFIMEDSSSPSGYTMVVR